jgi:outer membrane protein assembly factor BamB
VSGNQIYVIDEDGKLICLDRISGEVYWITDLSKFRSGKNIKNLNLWLGPYLINNLIYNISYFGEIKIVSPITGEILSNESIAIRGILVPPLILSNAIYLTDKNSNVYEVR